MLLINEINKSKPAVTELAEKNNIPKCYDVSKTESSLYD